jgi:hypothetical protein
LQQDRLSTTQPTIIPSRGERDKAEHRREHHLHHVLLLLRLLLAAHLECSPRVRIEPVKIVYPSGTIKLTPDLTTRTRPGAQRTSTAARALRSPAPRTPRYSHACHSPRVWPRTTTRLRMWSHQRAQTCCKSATSGRAWRSRMASAASRRVRTREHPPDAQMGWQACMGSHSIMFTRKCELVRHKQ